MGYSLVHLEEIDRTGPGNAVRFVRRALGVEAFGINWFDIPPNAEGHEHDEIASGQEEVSFVIAGDGHWRVDGEMVRASTGTFIRFDPSSTRVPIAGPNGLTFVSVGCPPGSYEARGPF